MGRSTTPINRSSPETYGAKRLRRGERSGRSQTGFQQLLPPPRNRCPDHELGAVGFGYDQLGGMQVEAGTATTCDPSVEALVPLAVSRRAGGVVARLQLRRLPRTWDSSRGPGGSATPGASSRRRGASRIFRSDGQYPATRAT